MVLCDRPDRAGWGGSAVDEDVAHRLRCVARLAVLSFFVSRNVRPEIADLLGLVHSFVQELPHFRSDGWFLQAAPDCFVRF